MNNEMDDFIYAPREDDGEAKEPEKYEKWKVIIVDDEKEVHDVTVMSLKTFTFDNKKLDFLHAYSGKEAKELIRKNPDTALILLDVVMETDDAGLQVTKYVRETLKYSFVRIVLRTGQPGQAPEKEVIKLYDINDYKEKGELTTQKLYTTLYSSLRSYRDIITIDLNKQGLQKIIEASSSLFELQSMEKFVSGVLMQLTSLLSLNPNSLFCKDSGFLADSNSVSPVILAGSGLYETEIGRTVGDVVNPEVLENLTRAHNEKRSIFTETSCTFYFQKNCSYNNMVYVETCRVLSETERQLAEVFCSNISVAFDNVHLYRQLTESQLSTIKCLAKLSEYKDTDTGEHIQRVAKISTSIAEKLKEMGRFQDQIDTLFIDHIGLASVLHDVGKVGVPEKILLKPARLDDIEWETMKSHSSLGGDVLFKTSSKIGGRNYLTVAAEIAKYHHEKYNGMGYPEGLKGNAIPLSARIVAVVDVYDALISKRPYKEAWEKQKAVDYIKEESGAHFDPEIVEAFLLLIDDNVD